MHFPKNSKSHTHDAYDNLCQRSITFLRSCVTTAFQRKHIGHLFSEKDNKIRFIYLFIFTCSISDMANPVLKYSQIYTLCVKDFDPDSYFFLKVSDSETVLDNRQRQLTKMQYDLRIGNFII